MNFFKKKDDFIKLRDDYYIRKDSIVSVYREYDYIFEKNAVIIELSNSSKYIYASYTNAYMAENAVNQIMKMINGEE